MRPSGPRDPVVGPPGGPEPPFPLRVAGEVVKGFGRGSKDLGIPTANIPIEGLSVGGHEDVESGVYYGWAFLSSIPDTAKPDVKEDVYPMVMSIGWNPFYKNEKRSVEVHIMHDFPADFYGARMSLLILGFIRPEYDYVSKEALIEDIRTDMEVARRGLERDGYLRWKDDKFFGGDEAS
ncbi:MAG: riboflavin kinase [Thelocarpon impressellum]|nr:MAG: riboflavin kinase [Thelocarpon impressellum]